MPDRKPQINFQVSPHVKRLYEEAKANGHWVTRLCAAGLLLMVEDPRIRQQAVNRLRDWEVEFENATPEQIRAFVQGAKDAMRAHAPGKAPARTTPQARKRAARSRSG